MGIWTAVDWTVLAQKPRTPLHAVRPPGSPASFQGSVGLLVGDPGSPVVLPDSSPLLLMSYLSPPSDTLSSVSLSDASFLSIPVFIILLHSLVNSCWGYFKKPSIF